MRNRLSINLEQAIAEGCLITTDSNGDAFYLTPLSNHDLLQFNGVGIEWTSQIEVYNLKISSGIGIEEQRVLSYDLGLNVTGNGSMMKYSMMYSDSLPIFGGPSPGAGPGATHTIQGSVRAGIIEIILGTVTAAGEIMDLFFGMLFPNGSSVVLFPHNANAALFSDSIYTEGFTNHFTINSTIALNSGDIFQWNYIIEGF